MNKAYAPMPLAAIIRRSATKTQAGSKAPTWRRRHSGCAGFDRAAV
jgi:hypothetical protein